MAKLTLRLSSVRRQGAAPGRTPMGVLLGTLTVSLEGVLARFDTQRERAGAAELGPTGPANGTDLPLEPALLLGVPVWLHDPRTDPADVLIDAALLPGAGAGDVGELSTPGGSRKLFFRVTPGAKPNMVSVQSGVLQGLMGLLLRSPVAVRARRAADVEADLVEIQVKDMHLSRGDMWHFASLLQGTCVYRTKRVTFIEGVRGTVHGIYRHRRKVFSGYVGAGTKVVFRLESARLTFLIQVSREMWHFEESGEILFQKLIHTVLPAIFERWQEVGTHHVITIVLFTSVDISNVPWPAVLAGQRFAQCTDYFRVVVDQVHLTHRAEILGTLRYEFSRFMRDILLVQEAGVWRSKGKFLPAVKGNLLEAINLAASIVSDGLCDPDLRHTGHQFVVITPAAGLFDVDYDLMVRTGEKMLGLEIGVDIICLAPPPLHVAPMFRYLRHNTLHHCLPTWIEASFCTLAGRAALHWVPRCKVYELQMMGVMVRDALATEIEPLGGVEGYDDAVFCAPALVKNTPQLTPPLTPHFTSNPSPHFFPPGPLASVTRRSSLMLLTRELSRLLVTRDSPNLLPPDTLSTLLTRDVSLPRAPSAPRAVTIASPRAAAMTTTAVFGSATRSRPVVSAVSALRLLHSGSPLPARPSPPALVIPVRTRSRAVRSAPRPARRPTRAAPDATSELFTPIANPSRTSRLFGRESYGRWKHTVTRGARKHGLNWRSLASPALLPLTTGFFPAPADFLLHYTFQTYDVLLNRDYLATTTNLNLARCMIYMRLTRGFQICAGKGVEAAEAERPGGNAAAIRTYLPSRAVCNGFRMYMSSGREIHRISADHSGGINVQVYTRVAGAEGVAGVASAGSVAGVANAGSVAGVASTAPAAPAAPAALAAFAAQVYTPLVKTRYSTGYVSSPRVLTPVPPVKWNQVDQVIAGFDDVTDRTMYHRIKFVVIPCEIPKGFASDADLNAEELRLDGFRKLIGQIHKGRFRGADEPRGSKEESVPEVTFYTGSFFDHLRALASAPVVARLFEDEGRLLRGTPATAVARVLLSAQGVALLDRRWHFTTYKQCFMGLSLTTWLVERFDDIDTRDAAVGYGNELMEAGVFRHVTNRHRFLDGHYFYQLVAEVAETPLEPHEMHPVPHPEPHPAPHLEPHEPHLEPHLEPHESNQPLPAPPTPHVSPAPLTAPLVSPAPLVPPAPHAPQVILSTALDVNVDPSGKLFKQEMVRVHYDRIHNPDHCFHIRLEWLNTTSKLIDDTVVSWSRLCERYGLRLVETPWQEVCTIPQANPFHLFVEVRLALDPWTDLELNDAEGERLLARDRFLYHIALLEQSGFMLDNRSGEFFNTEAIDVSYSWGRPTFKYAQYIHCLGVYFAEIRTAGDLFLAPNNYHISRINSGSGAKESFVNSHQLLLDFQEKCGDAVRLREVFRAAKSAALAANDGVV